jgi:hypothetical protein
LRPGSSRDPGCFTVRRRRGGRVPPSKFLARIPSQEWLSHGSPSSPESGPAAMEKNNPAIGAGLRCAGDITRQGSTSPSEAWGRSREVGAFLPISRAQRTSEDDGLATTKGPEVVGEGHGHHLRAIADCLDEVLRLQSRVMELTEQVPEAAGMNPGDRTLRGKVTGLFSASKRIWRSSIAWPNTRRDDWTQV